MNIKVGYNIGDKVKVLAHKKIIDTCPFCNGKGYALVKGTKLYCQNCNDGVNTAVTTTREETLGTITGVSVRVVRTDTLDEDDEFDVIDNDLAQEVEYEVTLEDNVNYNCSNYFSERKLNKWNK